MSFGCEVSCRRTLPAVYDDSLTYYEELCKLQAKLNEVIEHSNANAADIEKLKQAVAQLGELLDNWASGKFDDTIRDEVAKWVAENVEFIFETYAKQVFFGLTSDGYFCAYVPKSWSEISFDTGAIYGTEEYGRLILRFAADGQGVIDNRYDTRALYSAIDGILDVEAGDGLKHAQGKLSHKFENETDGTVAVSPQAVFAYAQPKA